jgi:hypothetical protein
VPGRVGSNAVYLANEANVIATPTKASNRLSFTYINPNTISVSFWLCVLKIPLSGQYTQVFSYGSSLSDSFTLQINADQTMNITTSSQSTTSSSVVINTWYHIYGSWTPSNTISFYKNGILVGNSSITEASISSGIFQLGESIRSSYNRPFAGFIDDFRIYNRALSATEIAALAGIAPIQVAPATTLASGLTTRLTFDNTTADAQGTLGAPTGTPAYSSISKQGVTSLDLTNNTIGVGTVTNSLTYAFTSGSFPLSIAFWFNISSTTSYQCPVNILGNNNAQWLFHYMIEGTTSYVRVFASGSDISTPAFTVSANTWYHIIVSFAAAGRMLFYVNGVFISSTSLGSATAFQYSTYTATSLRIGCREGIVPSSIAYPFKGYIDDVRIYNRALSPQEVAGLYYSYQPSPYVLYQQPIEGLNVADLGWGTTAAQPATVSAWIKNNTSSAQQFSLSAGNAGTNLEAYIPFDGTFIDNIGTLLTNPVFTGTASYGTSSGLFKVGTGSIYFANTAGSAPTQYVSYDVPATIQPNTISFWFRPAALSGYQTLFTFASRSDSSANGVGFRAYLYTNTTINIQFWPGSLYLYLNYTTVINTWYHCVITYITGGALTVYINGSSIGTASSVPTGNLVLYSSGNPINLLQIGGGGMIATYGYNGYIDDFRIYNKALTAAEVYQLYAKNAGNITTISQFLLPRSYLYTTPSIPANSWQKISFTIPGDTTDAAWAKDTTCGLNLALCLGAGGVYVSPETSGWASAEYTTGSNVQVFGGSATNFLASPNNNIYITGVQLERGTLMTPFEFRPGAVELQLCQRYYQQYTLYYLGLAYSGVFGYSHGLPLKQIMRAIPSLQSGATFTVNSGSAGTPVIYTATTEVVTVWNPSNNWTVTAELRFTGGFNAEL